MLSRLRALFRRAPSPPTLETTAVGFVLRDAAGEAVDVEWARVRRVVACKRDLLTTDCIVLLVELTSPALVVEVSEAWSGFGDVLGGMEATLGVSPAWYLEIMTPAFEPTPRLLYERVGAGAGPGAPSG